MRKKKHWAYPSFNFQSSSHPLLKSKGPIRNSTQNDNGWLFIVIQVFSSWPAPIYSIIYRWLLNGHLKIVHLVKKIDRKLSDQKRNWGVYWATFLFIFGPFPSNLWPIIIWKLHDGLVQPMWEEKCFRPKKERKNVVPTSKDSIKHHENLSFYGVS